MEIVTLVKELAGHDPIAILLAVGGTLVILYLVRQLAEGEKKHEKDIDKWRQDAAIAAATIRELATLLAMRQIQGKSELDHTDGHC